MRNSAGRSVIPLFGKPQELAAKLEALYKRSLVIVDRGKTKKDRIVTRRFAGEQNQLNSAFVSGDRLGGGVPFRRYQGRAKQLLKCQFLPVAFGTRRQAMQQFEPFRQMGARFDVRRPP